MAIMRRGLYAVIVLAALLLSGCGTVRWTEDVKTSDGTILKVKRKELYGSGGGIGEWCFRCSFRHAELEFEYRGNTYVWGKDGYVWGDKWHAIKPMIIDVRGEEVAMVSAAGVCTKELSPDGGLTFYVYYLWRDGKWQPSHTPPFPMLTERNLHYGKPESRKDLTLAAKEAVMADMRTWPDGAVEKAFYVVIPEVVKRKIVCPWQ